MCIDVKIPSTRTRGEMRADPHKKKKRQNVAVVNPAKSINLMKEIT